MNDVHSYVGVGVRSVPLAPLRQRGDHRESVGAGIGEHVLAPSPSPVLVWHAAQQTGVDEGGQAFAEHVVSHPELLTELIEASYA